MIKLKTAKQVCKEKNEKFLFDIINTISKQGSYVIDSHKIIFYDNYYNCDYAYENENFKIINTPKNINKLKKLGYKIQYFNETKELKQKEKITKEIKKYYLGIFPITKVYEEEDIKVYKTIENITLTITACCNKLI